MVIRYKGRWKNKKYNPNKPSKYHIKTNGVCDSATGYAFNILAYFGSDASYNPAMSDCGNSENILSIFCHHLGLDIMCLQTGFTQHIYCFSILPIRNTFTQVPFKATEKTFLMK